MVLKLSLKELKSYRMGIEASSYNVYDFDIKVDEYQETPKQMEFNFNVSSKDREALEQ